MIRDDDGDGNHDDDDDDDDNDNDDVHFQNTIENELLKELEDFEEFCYSSSQSSPSSSPHSTDFTKSSPSSSSSSPTLLDDDNDNVKNDGSIDIHILDSIPGFALFKETVELSSTTCLKARKVIDSTIQDIFGDQIPIEHGIVSRSGGGVRDDENDNENENENDEETIIKDVQIEDDVNQERYYSTNINSDTERKVKEYEVSTTKHNQPVSPFFEGQRGDTDINNSNSIMIAKEDLEHEKHEHSTIQTTTTIITKGNNNFISTILSPPTTTIENTVELNFAQELRKEAELEAKKEQYQFKKKQKHYKEKRVMDASKERELYLMQDKAARSIQGTLREIYRKKRAQRLRSIWKGMLECRRLEMSWKMRTSFHALCSFMIETKMTMIIQQYFRQYSERKKKRQRIMIQAMTRLIDCITLRKILFFWKVLVSTMKMEESLMKELMISTLRIQSTYRMYRAKLVLKKKKEIHMATIIQKNYRGYRALVSYNIKKEKVGKRNFEASTLIQSLYRGYTTRCRLNMAISTNYSYMDNDIDGILGHDEAELILNEICTMEGNDPESFVEDWIPVKPQNGAVQNLIDPALQEMNLIHSQQHHHEHQKSSKQNAIKQNEMRKEQKKQRLEKDDDAKPNARSNNHQRYNTAVCKSHEVETNAIASKHEQSNCSTLMKEWNLNDSRVIEVSVQCLLLSLICCTRIAL